MDPKALEVMQVSYTAHSGQKSFYFIFLRMVLIQNYNIIFPRIYESFLLGLSELTNSIHEL